MKRIALLALTLQLFISGFLYAQKDSAYHKEGLTFGILPAISFDADLGFQYGGLINLYWYGDGSDYPNYEHSLYMEASQYTGGSTLLRLYYDSPKITWKIRTTADITWFRDLAMDFYGFNGYQTQYNPSWEDDQSTDYVSRVFYRHHREMFRILTNFKGPIGQDSPFQWIGGLVFFDFKIGSVDIDRLNKRKDDDDKLPQTDGLYDKYLDWAIISDKEKDGGRHAYLKAGLSYDTRDRQVNASKGVWTELFLTHTPSFFSSHDQHFTRLTLFHRQYFSLTPKRNLIFAYRLGWQHKLSGHIPFYLLPHMASSVLTSATSQGLGGSKSLRGINRNRVVGDGFVLSNIELRWKMWRTKLFKQDFYLASIYFADMGLITQDYSVSMDAVPEEINHDYFTNQNDRPHWSFGLGLKAALNENFVLSADYGFAKDDQDGTSGLYISLNYLF